MLAALLIDEPAAPVLLLLAVALAVDWTVPEPTGFLARIPHPVRLLGWVIGQLDAKLNREQRSAVDRLRRGVVVALFLTIAALAAGLAVTAARQALPLFWLVELILVVSLLAQRSLHDHVLAVAEGLRRQGVVGGRQAVRKIVGRDPEHLDRHGIARAAVESCAENFSDGTVAPVFWYAVLGLPGILAYKTINTLDSMIGYRTSRYEAFGKAAAKMDDAVNWLPARLSAVYIALASGLAGHAGPHVALATAIRDASKHSSSNAGWPEAAMAGALALSLGGPRRYAGRVTADAWIGSGRTSATETDIRQALKVLAFACLVNAVVVVLAAVPPLVAALGVR